MILYYPHVEGSPPQDHQHGFGDFLHAASTVAHLANQVGVASTANPSSLRYWPKLEEDNPENRAELARRIDVLLDRDAHGLANDVRIIWAKKWRDQYGEESAITTEVDRAVGK